MKTILHSALLTMTLIAAPVFAETATIDFKGTITGGTCTLSTDSTNLELIIGEVNKSVFKTGDSAWAPSKVFRWTNCTASSISMQFTGFNDLDNSNLFRLDQAPGVATGVAIELSQTNSANRIAPHSVQTVTTSGGAASYSVTARYKKTKDPVTTGPANATITVLITYT